MQFDTKIAVLLRNDANRAAVRAVQGSDLNLVGIGVRAARKTVEKLTKGVTLHP